MLDILVYSCVSAAYDVPQRSVLTRTGRADSKIGYVLYTDTATLPTTWDKTDDGGVWQLRPLLWRHPLCARRTARWHKVNSHLLDVKAKSTIWVDGSQKLLPDVDLREALETALRGFALATFKHPERSCVYQELQACKNWHKDNPLLMQAQIDRYRTEGYPPYAGMVETACVMRRDSEPVRQFNREWWRQIESGSCRDQLSFNYVSRKLGVAYGTLPGHRLVSPYFEYVNHAR
jgi:hypothetical protein